MLTAANDIIAEQEGGSSAVSKMNKHFLIKTYD